MKKKLRKSLGSDYRWYMLASAAVFAVLSAFSICVFYHMRNFPDVTAYYTGHTASMAADIFSTPSYLYFCFLIPVFTGIFFYCLMNEAPLSMAGLACSFFFAFNMIVSLSMEHSDLSAILLPLRAVGVDMILHVAAFLGFLALCFFGVHLLYTYFDHKIRRQTQNFKSVKRERTAYWLAFLLMAAGWAPGFIICYPTSMHSDTMAALLGIYGYVRIDVSYPILTTLFYGALYSLGQSLSGDNLSVFLCSFVQSLLNLFIFAKVAVQVRKYTKSNWWYFFTVVYFAVCPVWAKGAQFSLKDIMHSGCFLLFCMQFFACLMEEKSRLRDVIWLGVCFILIAFTRKATFWLAVICTVVLIAFHWKAYWLKYGVCLALVMGLFFFCNKVLYPSLGFKGECEVENYSLPFQQMAMYCRTHQDEITEEEKKIINTTLDFDRIIADYTPMISDPVKNTFKSSTKDRSEFWALYPKFFQKHPLTFLKSFIMGSFEHSNPWYSSEKNNNIYISSSESFNSEAYYVNKSGRWQMNLYWQSWADIPVLRLFMGTGSASWIMLAVLAYSVHKRCGRGFLSAFPSLVLWIGLFLSHVNGLIRYGYPLIAATPLICAFTIYAVSQKAIKEHISQSASRRRKENHSLQWLSTFGVTSSKKNYYDL